MSNQYPFFTISTSRKSLKSTPQKRIERIKAYKERLAVSFGLCLFVFLLLAFMLVAPTMSSVSQAAASVSLGDRVWHDANSNGEQDTSEGGIGGVTVNLYDGTGLNAGNLLSSTVTNADGYYLFTTEDSEDYQVQFVLPSGYTFTTQDAVVTDTIDSDANTSTGATDVFTLSAEDTTQDAGLIAPTTCDTGSNDIGGTIYRDYNADGRQASGERAYTGLVITAYDSSNAVLTTTVSRPDDGLFVFPSLAASAPVRLEFTNLATGLEFGASGTGSDTGVQFINAATCEADLSLNEPQDYCQNAPDLVSTCYVAGDPLDTSGGSPGSRAGDYDATISFSYHNSIGKSGDVDFVAPTHLADTKEVGSVWGLAYDKEREIIYQAAFLKRHVGLGPSGLSGIYATSLTGTITTTQFITLTDLSINVGTIVSRNLTYDPAQNTRDPDAFDKVGKVGLGDIDISEDGSTLYIINLFDRELIALDTASKTISSQITVPNQGCQNGLIRPFAVKVYKGEVYVGAVCSAENSGTSADLSAHILQLDGAAFVSLLSFDLDEFTRGRLSGSYLNPGAWLPWNSSWQNLVNSGTHVIYPVPMLSDIEFDVDGSLILGFMDRSGHTVNYQNYHPTVLTDTVEYSVHGGGDVLRACKVGNQFFIEGTAGLCDYNIEGQPKQGDEYYTGLNFDPHYETAIGGLAQLPGSGEIVSTVYDPLAYNSGGIKWLENSDGSLDRAFQLFSSNDAFSGKANGLGDLELLCDPAPLEIGNYIWEDTDGDGIQEAGESPLAGVVIGLYDSSGNLLATATTDSEGHYYFINADDPRLSTVFSDTVPINYGLIPTTTIGLSVNTNNYQIRVDTTQGTLTNYTLTDPDTGSGSNADEHDSDASTSGNNVIVTVNTGTAGQNNHSIDIGFEPPALAVDLASFEASCQAGEAQIRWQTVSELDNLGFNLLRSTSAEGEGQPLNSDLIMSQAPGSGSGAFYEWLDGEVEAGTTYYYSLQDINVGGTISQHGPLSATCEENTTAIQLTSLTTSNTSALIVGWLLAIMLVTGIYLGRRRKCVRREA